MDARPREPLELRVRRLEEDSLETVWQLRVEAWRDSPFVAAEKFPAGRWVEPDDTFSIHIGAFDAASGVLMGATRLTPLEFIQDQFVRAALQGLGLLPHSGVVVWSRLVVGVAWQGRGIGYRLESEAITQAANHGTTLACMASSPSRVASLTSRGFQLLGYTSPPLSFPIQAKEAVLSASLSSQAFGFRS